MGDSLSLVFAMILGVLIMFFFPMLDSWERQDDLSYMSVYTSTVDLVDAVRNTGVLTDDMLHSYMLQLGSTANSYDVVMEHREYKVVPAGAGSSEIVYLNHYSNEIEEKLNIDGYYPFNKGDYFYISVKNTNKTQATVMKEAIYSTAIESFKVGVPYGGQIKTSYR
ncbi:MAG: hypothetical protein IJX99_04640 [Clostridia bacterium]|nr:hypothetical protein [Clostridia bacterium]